MATMRPIELDAPKVHHIPEWDRMDDRQRVAFLRSIAEPSGRDPRIRYRAHQILAEAGVEQRDYRRQADTLLRWIHTNIAYLNEPGEILQDPLYTLKVGHADCDDMALLLAALCESLRLPWRFCLSGLHPATKEKKRWIEGTPFPRGVQMAHIYVVIGWPPYQPTTWAFAEPTIKGFPLGMDVVMAANGQAPPALAAAAPRASLPELSGPDLAGPRFTHPVASYAGSTTASTAAGAAGGSASALLTLAARSEDAPKSVWRTLATKETAQTIIVAGIVGAISSVLSDLLLRAFRATKKKG
jgi:hypothetical protein